MEFNTFLRLAGVALLLFSLIAEAKIKTRFPTVHHLNHQIYLPLYLPLLFQTKDIISKIIMG